MSIINQMKEVKSKYLTMGTWNTKKLAKSMKGNRTKSSPARSYIAVPPPEGWPGGDPLKNGLKA